MSSTTGYSAGAETTDVVMSIVPETAWGTTPNSALTALRITGENLAGTKQRSRPNEITGVRRVAPAVTQQEQAGGSVNYNLSYGTFDEIMRGAVGGDWTAAINIVGAAGDISTAATGNKLTSTTAGKFTSIAVNQWVELRGFAGANNGFYRVSAKTSNQDITLAGKTVTTETPAGTAASVLNGGMLRNGDLVRSYTIQKRFASNQFLVYKGSIITGFSIRGGVGQFFTGAFNILSKEETKATASAGNGTVNAAPTGGFFDTVANFGGVQIDDTTIAAAVTGVSLDVSREGAGMDYGMGSAAAQGGRFGQVMINGTIEMFFKDFNTYDIFKSEAEKEISFRMKDSEGATYCFTLLGANIMNPQITAGGPNQAVAARFEIEGGNDLGLPAIQIDRFGA
jgi:hypothetical protein